MLFCGLWMLLACSANRIGIGEIYAVPVTPECVTMIDGIGMYNYRGCDIKTIGRAWIMEKRLREKYEKQITIINN